MALGVATWYAAPNATGTHLTSAGYWYSFVSIPIMQFILLRWYLRLVIWFLFLWRVSQVEPPPDCSPRTPTRERNRFSRQERLRF